MDNPMTGLAADAGALADRLAALPMVPGVRLAAGADADAVTVRHLLGHSSGIDAGDLFVDVGDDDGCLAAYVELVAEAGLLFEPGRWMSYNNAGFVLAGRLVEEVRGEPWDVV